jgi:hypothetical protein
VIGEPLCEVVERRERGHQHHPCRRHPLEQLGSAIKGKPVLDRIDALLDRNPRAVEPFGVRRDAVSHPMCLVDHGADLGPGQLRRLGILAYDRPRAGGNHLHEVGAEPELFSYCLAELVLPVGLAIHRPEDAAPGGRRRDDAAA